MNKFRIGDRVAIYADALGVPIKTKIVNIIGNMVIVLRENGELHNHFHYKQCRKLVKKKKYCSCEHPKWGFSINSIGTGITTCNSKLFCIICNKPQKSITYGDSKKPSSEIQQGSKLKIDNTLQENMTSESIKTTKSFDVFEIRPFNHKLNEIFTFKPGDIFGCKNISNNLLKVDFLHEKFIVFSDYKSDDQISNYFLSYDYFKELLGVRGCVSSLIKK